MVLADSNRWLIAGRAEAEGRTSAVVLRNVAVNDRRPIVLIATRYLRFCC